MYFRKKKSKIHRNDLKQNTCNKKVSIPLYEKKKRNIALVILYEKKV